MFDFIDKIIAEATAVQIQRKQGSITRLFPTFFDRTKAVASKGGLRLHDINVNTWYFKVHSGTEDDVWYDDVVHFVNVVPLLDKLVKDKRLWIADGSRVDRSKLARRFLDQVDIKLSCSCPAFLYYGSDYILSLNKYRAKYGDPETRAPRIRNPKQYGILCKHLHNMLKVLPFYSTTITKWLTQFYDKDIVGFEAEAKKELSKYKVAGAELGKKKKEKERHPVFAKESKIPKVLVHVTRRENIDSIKKYGLIAVADEVMGEDDTPGVNFVDKKNNDLLPVIPAYDRSYIKVNTEDLNPLKFLDLGSGWYRYLGNISPKYIKVIENESRVKLDEEVAIVELGKKKKEKEKHPVFVKESKLDEDLSTISDPKLKKIFGEEKIENLQVKIRSLERLAKTEDKNFRSPIYAKIDAYEKELALLKKNLEQDVKENKEDDKKYQWFLERTNKHINLVQKAIKKIVDAGLEELQDEGVERQLIYRGKIHDVSKFEEPEMIPYIELSWNKKIENETGKKIKSSEEVTKAILHHITINIHHPEYHLEDKVEANINKNDRDKSDKCVDAFAMLDLDIIEMIADWQAMAEELKKNTAREWFNKQKDVRWHFSKKQEQLIDKVLKVFEKE